jgi:hypothetical protein
LTDSLIGGIIKKSKASVAETDQDERKPKMTSAKTPEFIAYFAETLDENGVIQYGSGSLPNEEVALNVVAGQVELVPTGAEGWTWQITAQPKRGKRVVIVADPVA